MARGTHPVWLGVLRLSGVCGAAGGCAASADHVVSSRWCLHTRPLTTCPTANTNAEAEHTAAVLVEPLRPFLVSADSEASCFCVRWVPVPPAGWSAAALLAVLRNAACCVCQGAAAGS